MTNKPLWHDIRRFSLTITGKQRLRYKIIISTALFILALNSSAEGMDSRNTLKLQLPPAIYAVPGVEANIYFDNVVLVVNANNYVFDVDCVKGNNDAKRWHFLPKKHDAGEYVLKIKVFNVDNKLLGQAETRLIVVPRDAGSGRNISLLVIGDSLTNASAYVRRINELFQRPENPKLKFIGSHSGSGKKTGADGICHEGYGGWSWLSFCGMWTEKKGYRAKSKFLTVKNGKKNLDFKSYFDKYNHGKTPDFITIMLGTNDIFAANDENIDETIQSTFQYMDIFLKKLSKSAPDAKIGIALTPPPAASQDAFGTNYKCGQTRWQFKRNQHHLVRSVIKKITKSTNKNISLIPVYINLDTENGFPVRKEQVVHGDCYSLERQSNGVHPSDRGYKQIGDSFYTWMKYIISKDI